MSEALIQLHSIHTPAVRQKITGIIPSWSKVRRHLPLGLQTSTIGTVVGPCRHRRRHRRTDGL
ncbi:hypothetical protein FLP41_20040 [Paracoccus marcusii]|uniref:hypothetical protein n=1 Tax=Paracoccus marcusii TaxID=59779 RepID=UPI002ED32E42|nr:hypothetical protein FLP41_20040 [Paracoccus marcusii]